MKKQTLWIALVIIVLLILALIITFFRKMRKDPKTLKISSRGLDLIKKWEGLKLVGYLDPVGVPTIGYGHTRTAVVGATITEKEADRLLRQDVVVAEDDVRRLVRVPLNQSEFDALVSFTYNLGGGNLSKSTLLRKLNASDYAGAAAQFPLWNKAGGRVLQGLVKRRAEEQKLFLSTL